MATKKKSKANKGGSSANGGSSASGGSEQEFSRSSDDSSPSDLTKNVFDEGGLTNGSSDDSAMERMMNKSIESFSDTSSDSNMMSVAKRGNKKHGVYPPVLKK